MSIFPIIGDTPVAAEQKTLPLMREVARDENGCSVFRGGVPVTVTGAEAVVAWALAALHSHRCSAPASSKNYGSEFHSLLGDAYTEDVKTAIVPGMMRDCLLQCPYITDVEDIKTNFTSGRLSVSAALKTIYGEVDIRVNDSEIL